VVPLAPQLIDGVTAGRGSARDTITPLYCIECDSNSWYRWLGRTYEEGLYAVGERLQASESGRGLALFSRPARDSGRTFPIERCDEAIVRRVAGSKQERWYYVETVSARPVRGWIPGAFVARGTECIA
jgi:hypothetical protein